ncbi:tail fiber domain-containing protein [Dyadobacter sp. 676]|uniref:Tail fiber domain-containing protein n=1 Tax=Dyadobacter sp. 676 TaxID=3088362 RepID=A0AAU8FQQ8_9BACT
MEKLRNLKWVIWGALVLGLSGNLAFAQVGIGTETPVEKLHVEKGSFLVTSPVIDSTESPFYGSDPTADSLRYFMKWFQDRSALVSFGGGMNSQFFDPTFFNQHTGQFSLTSGFESFASGIGAAVFGLRSSAQGRAAFAAGFQANAISSNDFAVGTNAVANGTNSVAIGDQVSTNGHYLSFVFGSGVTNDKDHQMIMGFSGGYKLFTNNAANIGAQLSSGSNAWSVISDVNKKENFAPVNGEDFLQKISKMNLTSWNYKGQDPKQFRHYGPMAQDFYKAFGQDAYGTIGNDTTINQADFDGVNLVAIQALIRRMDQVNSDLRAELAEVKAQLSIRNKRSKNKRVLISKK